MFMLKKVFNIYQNHMFLLILIRNLVKIKDINLMQVKHLSGKVLSSLKEKIVIIILKHPQRNIFIKNQILRRRIKKVLSEMLIQEGGHLIVLKEMKKAKN